MGEGPSILQLCPCVSVPLPNHPNLSGLWLPLPSVAEGTFHAGRQGLFPVPVQVFTWILSQPWDLGGQDEHNYADENGHCPIRHHAVGSAGRAGLVAQDCSGVTVWRDC